MEMRKDLDLKDFEATLKKEKTKIEEKLDAIRAEVNRIAIEDDIDDIGDMTELQIENTVDQKLLHQLEAEKAEIDAALGRIMGGTYGICEKTGKAIPIDRLKANLWARTVVNS